MKLIIHRKKKFASSLVPFYIILSESKEQFVERYGLQKDNARAMTWSEQPVLLADFDPKEYGIPIKNGETLELEAAEETKSVFAMTMHGLLSNEIVLDAAAQSAEITITAKGGWSTPSYPVLF